MSRGFSAGKRQREAERARKKRDKAERRRQKRERGAVDIPVTTAEAITSHLPTSDEAMVAMHERASAPREAAKIAGRLFVGGLSRDTDTDGLRAAFEAFGEVEDAIVMRDRDTGESRGFGFVTFADRRDAAKALEGMNDTELDGRTLYVDDANSRKR